jgi:hypothetical protein
MGPLPVSRLFNKFVLGLEIIYPGDQAMRDVQYRSAAAWGRVVAQVCARGDVQRIRAHAETSITGKWDPGHAPGRTIDMTAFRDAVGREDDLTPDEHAWLKFVYDRVAGILHQRYYVPDPHDSNAVREVGAGAAGATPAHVLDTLDGNYLVRQLLQLAGDDGVVGPEKVKALAESVARRLPRELEGQFTSELHAALEG